MTKIICIGDPHFRIDNVKETEVFTEKISELIKNENPDMCVILGDLLHTHERVHITPLNNIYNFIKKIISFIEDTYILVGNHDMISDKQFLTDNHWMNGMKDWKGVFIVDKVTNVIKNGINITLCPYVSPGRFIEALNTSGNEWINSDIIFAHQEFKGCKMGPILSIIGDEWSEEYPVVISGHIHSRQVPQKNIYYPGSSMQIAFGESEKNIIPIIDIQPENTKDLLSCLREIDLCLPRKRTFYMSVSEIKDFDPSKYKHDNIRITLSGEVEEFKTLKKTKIYKDLINKNIKIVFKQNKTDILSKINTNTNKSDFMVILKDIISESNDIYLEKAYNDLFMSQ